MLGELAIKVPAVVHRLVKAQVDVAAEPAQEKAGEAAGQCVGLKTLRPDFEALLLQQRPQIAFALLDPVCCDAVDLYAQHGLLQPNGQTFAEEWRSRSRPCTSDVEMRQLVSQNLLQQGKSSERDYDAIVVRQGDACNVAAEGLFHCLRAGIDENGYCIVGQSRRGKVSTRGPAVTSKNRVQFSDGLLHQPLHAFDVHRAAKRCRVAQRPTSARPIENTTFENTSIVMPEPP